MIIDVTEIFSYQYSLIFDEETDLRFYQIQRKGTKCVCLFQVPILGSVSVDVRSTSASGFVRRADVAPLAGTMEDPNGMGLVPIVVGAPALDPVTGKIPPLILGVALEQQLS